MQVFRSHYNQSVVTSTGDDMGPNNGYKTDVPETGGDMGGAVLTVQSQLYLHHRHQRSWTLRHRLPAG